MSFNQRLTSLVYFIFLNLFASIIYAQVNVGSYYSTFHLPAASFRTNGIGITGEYEPQETSVYYLSLGYFRKRFPVDSTSYLPPGGADPVHVKFTDKYSFLNISAGFIRYLAGGTRYDTRFGFYLGAGLGVLFRQLRTDYQTLPSQYEKSKLTAAGFEFLIGADVKLGFAKLFIRGKMDIMLKHAVDIADDTALPLLTNTQAGILVPLMRK